MDSSFAELDDLMKEVSFEMDHVGDETHVATCVGCWLSIAKGVKTFVVNEKKYHAECLACKTCHKSVATEAFYNEGNDFVCNQCYIASREKCDLCARPITGSIVKVKDKPYHVDCFVCSECKKTLDGVAFFTLPDTVWICDTCYQPDYPTCTACLKIITPDKDDFTYVQQGDNAYHNECVKPQSSLEENSQIKV